MDKDPRNWILIDWVFAFLFPLLGGVTNFAILVRQEKLKFVSVFVFVCEVIISCFVGIMVFMIMHEFDYPYSVSAGASGMCGHMGARILYLFKTRVESVFAKFIDEKIGITKDGSKTK